MSIAQYDKKVMSKRRMGPENSVTRALLLDATEAVMCDEGYAAVTSRRVAEKAGLKQQLVYYYFLTMDDLLLATFRRSTDRLLGRIETVLASDQPLHALLELMSNPERANLSMEYMALGNHNAAIRAEIVKFSEHIRQLQFETFSARLKPRPGGPNFSSPSVAVFVMHCISQILHWETAIGMSGGHPEARAYLEQLVDMFEPPTIKKPRRRESAPA
jgi:AcrR family transcriptional regulator